MNQRLKKVDRYIFKYARKAGIKRISVKRRRFKYIYSGKDLVTGTKWREVVRFNSSGIVRRSFQTYSFSKKTRHKKLFIDAYHSGKNGYIKFLKAGNTKKHSKRFIEAAGPNKLFDRGDAPYLAFAFDQLPGLRKGPFSVGVRIGGSDYSWA